MASILIKFQWSRKFDDGTIFMVQAETADELVLAKTEVESKFLNNLIDQTAPKTNTTQYSCNTCGGKAELKEGTSKKGNYYKIMKCNVNESHDRFMK